MNQKELLELWEARFHKILKLEADAHGAYKKVLKDYSHILVGSRLRSLIRDIMHDEKRHMEIAQKLLKIVEKKRKAGKNS